jgi:hypothetical protein
MDGVRLKIWNRDLDEFVIIAPHAAEILADHLKDCARRVRKAWEGETA